MKKRIFILMMCLLTTAVSAKAVNWINLEDTPQIKVYIDTDSVKYIKYDTATYALLYQKANEGPRVAYVKSNYSDNTAGIIRTEDYELENYKPTFYSHRSVAFMKQVDDSFINMGHNYALSLYPVKGASLYKAKLYPTNLKYVSYKTNNDKLGLSAEDYSAYIKKIKAEIFSNWAVPTETQNTKIVMDLCIGNDGSFKGYRIVKSNALDIGNRAAVAAVEKAAPFTGFPENADSKSGDLQIRVTFDYKFIRKLIY